MTPQKTTTAPAPGRPTEFARLMIESGSSVTRTVAGAVAPPLTGGISASSSPAAITASSLAYSRLTATRAGIAGSSSLEPGLARGRRERVGDRRPLGQLERQPIAPGALAKDREQSNLDLHRAHRRTGWAGVVDRRRVAFSGEPHRDPLYGGSMRLANRHGSSSISTRVPAG